MQQPDRGIARIARAAIIILEDCVEGSLSEEDAKDHHYGAILLRDCIAQFQTRSEAE